MKSSITGIAILTLLLSFQINCSHAQIKPPSFSAKILSKANYKIPGEGFPATGTVTFINGNAYVSGDIFIGDSAFVERFQFMQFSSVSNRSASIWPSGIIPYEIESSFSTTEKRNIIDALNHVMDKTNVLFIPRSTQDDFVRFKRYTVAQLGFLGGTAPLGRQQGTGMHEIKLSQFDMPLVAHEILHVLGVMHEHTRNDRDNFIEILRDNIVPAHRGFFEKFPRNDTRDVGSYDFNSIMHYNFSAFGLVENGVQRQTIAKFSNRADRTFGNATQLSPGDIRGVNSLYTTNAGRRIIPYTGDLVQHEMSVGQSRSITVHANRTHNFVNVFVRDGQKFEIRVTPTSQKWKGGLLSESTATGYTRGFGDVPRRNGNMMQLMGEIFKKNNDTGTFIEGSGFNIGTSRNYTASRNGYLVLYGNDNIIAYGDNSGSITVSIKRVL
jgi:hypothetical protein